MQKHCKTILKNKTFIVKVMRHVTSDWFGAFKIQRCRTLEYNAGILNRQITKDMHMSYTKFFFKIINNTGVTSLVFVTG